MTASVPPDQQQRMVEQVRRRFAGGGVANQKLIDVQIERKPARFGGSGENVSVTAVLEQVGANGLPSIREEHWDEQVDDLVGESFDHEETALYKQHKDAWKLAAAQRARPEGVTASTEQALRDVYKKRVQHARDRITHLRADSRHGDHAAAAKSIGALEKLPQTDENTQVELRALARAKLELRTDRDLKQYRQEPRTEFAHTVLHSASAVQGLGGEASEAARVMAEKYPGTPPASATRAKSPKPTPGLWATRSERRRPVVHSKDRANEHRSLE